MGFVDLTKAFDNVSRDLLWEVLAKYGCVPKFIRMIKLMHVGMMAAQNLLKLKPESSKDA